MEEELRERGFTQKITTGDNTSSDGDLESEILDYSLCKKKKKKKKKAKSKTIGSF